MYGALIIWFIWSYYYWPVQAVIVELIGNVETFTETIAIVLEANIIAEGYDNIEAQEVKTLQTIWTASVLLID